MSKKTCRRTVRDPMGWILKRSPMADDQQRDIGLTYRISLQGLLTGHGNGQAWATVSCALQFAAALCERGIHAHALHTIRLAQEAMVRTRERAKRHGKWALDGDGIRAVQDAFNIHDQQIKTATRAVITETLEEVRKMVEEGELV